MVCICCCAAYLERDIDCIGTEYTQMVIEMTGFGPTIFCECPNELGTIVIDFYDTTQDIYTFCVTNANVFWTAEVLTYGASAAEGFYNPITKAHDFSPNQNEVVVRIFSHNSGVKTLTYTITIVNGPSGQECESCASFLANITTSVYEAFATAATGFGCNSSDLDWYLQ